MSERLCTEPGAPTSTKTSGAAYSGKPAARRLWLEVAVCGIVPLLLMVAYVTNVGPWTRQRGLHDSDCYVHLLRAEDLWTTGEWFDSVVERANAPFGDELHWTRPFDLLLLAGAAPASRFVGIRSALFWWGAIVSPVLLFCTLLALRWAVKPLLSREAISLATLFCVAQLGLFIAFLPGRPDHHSLLVLLFVLLVGFVLRLLKRPFDLPLCYGAGAIAALSMWVSVESIVAVTVSLAALTYAWAARGGEALRKLLHYSIALSSSTAVALLIERPPGTYGVMELDRLSVAYVSVFSLLTLLLTGIAVLDRSTGMFKRTISRFAGIVVSAGVLALVVWLSFPEFYQSPLADVDPEVGTVYIERVAEMRPLFAGTASLTMSVPLIGAAVFTIPFAFLAGIGGRDKIAWRYIGFLALLFLVLSVHQQRWIGYSQVAITVALAEMLTGRLPWLDRKLRAVPRRLVRTLFLVGCWYALAFSGVLAATIAGVAETTDGDVSLTPICRHLEHAKQWQGRQLRIVTHTFWGGELLYRTRHEVVGTPYHRNTAGILDTHRILTAATDAEALAIVRERGIDTILLYPGTRDARFYCEGREASTFYQRLCEDPAPPWCRAVELPQELSPALFFEVLPP